MADKRTCEPNPDKSLGIRWAGGVKVTGPPRLCFTLWLPGGPVAKARPRVVCQGGRPRLYSQGPGPGYERRLRQLARRTAQDPLSGPCRVELEFRFPTKGTPRKREPRPSAWKTSKPDLDNLVKSALDGLNEAAYVDDAQVVELAARMFHTEQGGRVGTLIRVLALEETDQ